MSRISHIFLAFLLTVTVMQEMSAQIPVDFDVMSVEAGIRDHRRLRSKLQLRASMEAANEILHKAAKESVGDNFNISAELDKYDRYFDMIDLVYTTFQVGFNTRQNYRKISSRVHDFAYLYRRYYEICLSHGDVYDSDRRLLTSFLNMFIEIQEEGQDIYDGMEMLWMYAVGQMNCTTVQLINIITEIDRHFTHVYEIMDSYYQVLLRYMLNRVGLWDARLFQARTLSEVAQDAFDRWKRTALDVR